MTKANDNAKATVAQILQESAEESAALWTGNTCDACDKPHARAIVNLRYFDAPEVKAALCLACMIEAAEDAANVEAYAPRILAPLVSAEESAPLENDGHTGACVCPDCAALGLQRQSEALESAQRAPETAEATINEARDENALERCKTCGALLTDEDGNATLTTCACVPCELCDKAATQRVKFAGSMTLACDGCAADIKRGRA